MNYKKIISFLVVLVMLFGMTIGTGAVKADTSGDYDYYVNTDGTVTITLYNGSGGDVIIPPQIDGKDVTAIGDEAFYDPDIRDWVDFGFNVHSEKIKSIIIPDTVKSIGGEAFYRCAGLTTIIIPNKVSNIGGLAFACCTGVTNIKISNNVTNIGCGAFADCNILSQINVDENNPYYKSVDGVLFNKIQSVLMSYPIGKTGATYKIPSSVTTIGMYAFYRSLLTNIRIPDNVTTIEDRAMTLSNLQHITLPKKLTSIGESEFYSCSKLISVKIPSNVTEINDEAFHGCYSLHAAYFQGNAPSTFGTGVFSGCNSDFKIYYKTNSTGFTSPTWNGYNTAIYGDSRFIVTVMDSNTWEPVAGATVKVADQTTVTDYEGIAELLGVTPGDTDISITKNNVDTSSGESAYEDFSDKCNVAAKNGSYFTFLDPAEQ